jgi:hypothetical protein
LPALEDIATMASFKSIAKQFSRSTIESAKLNKIAFEEPQSQKTFIDLMQTQVLIDRYFKRYKNFINRIINENDRYSCE